MSQTILDTCIHTQDYLELLMEREQIEEGCDLSREEFNIFRGILLKELPDSYLANQIYLNEILLNLYSKKYNHRDFMTVLQELLEDQIITLLESFIKNIRRKHKDFDEYSAPWEFRNDPVAGDPPFSFRKFRWQ